MKKTVLFVLLASLSLALTSCRSDDSIWGSDGSSANSGSSDDGSSTSTDAYSNSGDDISATTFARTVTITFSDSKGASVSGAEDGEASVSGNDVTITYTGEECIKYVLTGSTSDGFFKLYSSHKQAIVLDDVSIQNPNGAAINNQSHKRTFVVVNGENTLKDGSSYGDETDDEDMKAVFFSEGQLVFSGDGSLEVTAKGKAGITSDDYVRFMGDQTVTVNSSAGHGVRGGDAIIVTSGTIDIEVSANTKKGFSSDSLVQVDGGVIDIVVTGSAAKDDEGEYTGTAGIKADQLFVMNDGTLTITNSGKGGKGISGDAAGYFKGGKLHVETSGSSYSASSDDISSKGIKFDGNLYFSGGDIYVKCGTDEGIESKGIINILGGTIYVWAKDDAVNSKGDMTISGGSLRAHSTGNDAIDANKNLIINGGVIIAEGAGGAENGLDAAEGYNIYVNGGYIVATGGSTSATASASEQASVAGSCSKNTYIALCNGDDAILTYYTRDITATALMISAPELKSGSSYTLKSGVSVSGGTTYFELLNVGGSVSGGSSSSSLTAAYSVGTAMGGGGMGGGGMSGGGPGGSGGGPF